MGCIDNALATAVANEPIMVRDGAAMVEGETSPNVRIKGTFFTRLADAIMADGLATPIILTPNADGKYDLRSHTHHRRYKAITGLVRPMVVKEPRYNNSMTSRRPPLYTGK